jgi:DUF971 family protein
MLRWDDGHAGPVPLTRLRDACPCAECAGESVLFAHAPPAQVDRATPGRYALVHAEPVGSYALRFVWGDGHELGLYTWEHLRDLCGCDECTRMREQHGEDP